MAYKPTLCFDFDGVIHSYTSGWKGAEVLPDPPVEGIKEALTELQRDYKITILSSRCASDAGIIAMQDWLKKYEIPYDMITRTKPPAVCYIDDRAICFDGNPQHMLDKVKNFKPWQEKDTVIDLRVVNARISQICKYDDEYGQCLSLLIEWLSEDEKTHQYASIEFDYDNPVSMEHLSWMFNATHSDPNNFNSLHLKIIRLCLFKDFIVGWGHPFLRPFFPLFMDLEIGGGGMSLDKLKRCFQQYYSYDGITRGLGDR